MKANRVLLSLLISSVALVATVSAAQQPVSDDFIADSVRVVLAANTVVKGGAIEVDVLDGAVTLAGKVPTARIKAKAGSLAKNVKGVMSARNNLTIAPAH
jgi:osmotically-inducible protein OsmY